MKDTSVAVVGAGIAGLVCSQLLIENGVSVTLFEATERVGGRIKSIRFEDGNSVELGANWLHEARGRQYNSTENIENPIRYFFSEGILLDISTDKTFDGTVTLNLDQEQSLATWLIKAKQDAFLSSKRLEFPENIPIIDLIDFDNISILKQDYARIMTMGLPLEEMSANYLEAYDSSFTDYKLIHESDLFISNGYDKVTNKILSNIESSTAQDNGNFTLELSTVIQKIDTTNLNRVAITTDKTTTEQFDFGVSTLPIGYLKSHQENIIGLPQWKYDAINRIGISLYNKIILPIDKSYFESHEIPIETVVLNHHQDAPPYTINNLYAINGSPTLIVSFVGNQLINEHYSEADTLNYLVSKIQAITESSEAIHFTEDPIFTHWENQEFTLGSYSMHSVEGGFIDNALLATRVNRLHFAGEATSVLSEATVNGAYISGVRCALEILDILNIESTVDFLGSPSYIAAEVAAIQHQLEHMPELQTLHLEI